MRRLVNGRTMVAALCLIVLGAAVAQSQTKSTKSTTSSKSTKSESTAPKAETSKKSEGWLGVYTQELTEELREGISYKGEGVLVSGVVDDSPADKVGLRKGDVITAVGTVAVSDPDELAEAVRDRKGGETVTVKIMRDGKALTLSPQLADRSDRGDMEFTAPFTMYDDDDHGNHVWYTPGRGRLGVRVENLNPDLNGYFNAPGGNGALVVEVVDESAAEKAGIKAGDVITSVGGTKVDDTDDLIRALRKQEDEKVTVQVSRKGASKSFQVELEQMHYRTWMGPEFERQMRSIEPRVRARVRALEIPSDEMKRDLDELKREVEDLKRELNKKDS
jgi:serine protease Do